MSMVMLSWCMQSQLFSWNTTSALAFSLFTYQSTWRLSLSRRYIKQRWCHLHLHHLGAIFSNHLLHFLSLHIKALLQQLGVRIEQSSPASKVGDKDKDGKGESSLASQSSFWAWTDNSQSAFSTSSDLESVECNLNRIKKIKSMFRYIHNTSRE